jgi:hypothetical protein
MVVFTAKEISVGSALGYFEQHKISVSSGKDLRGCIGSPNRSQTSPKESLRLSMSNHDLKRVGPFRPVTQHIPLRPDSCAIKNMATKI